MVLGLGTCLGDYANECHLQTLWLQIKIHILRTVNELHLVLKWTVKTLKKNIFGNRRCWSDILHTLCPCSKNNENIVISVEEKKQFVFATTLPNPNQTSSTALSHHKTDLFFQRAHHVVLSLLDWDQKTCRSAGQWQTMCVLLFDMEDLLSSCVAAARGNPMCQCPLCVRSISHSHSSQITTQH